MYILKKKNYGRFTAGHKKTQANIENMPKPSVDPIVKEMQSGKGLTQTFSNPVNVAKKKFNKFISLNLE
jgi:hypothetical protein